jgi:multidrug transporter EmrE-like cation transporter
MHPDSTVDRTPEEREMSAIKIAGIVLIMAGALGLLYGRFSFSRETHEAHVGSMQLTMHDRETVNIPVWAGVGAIVAGGLMLVVPGRRKS